MFEENVTEIGDHNCDDFLLREISILSFVSENCMRCLMSLPILDSLAEEFSEKIFFGKVNVDEFNSLAERHNISSVPTVLIFKNGEELDRVLNFDSEEDLRERLSFL